jgi:hypothetical protein
MLYELVAGGPCRQFERRAGHNGKGRNQIAQAAFISTGAWLDANHSWRSTMPFSNLIITLIVVGVLLWLVNNYLPMDGKIKSILNLVVVIAVILWLLRAFAIV